MKFTKLETKKCIEYNSRYKIYFENETCLEEFHYLQEFRCQVCYTDDALFSNLKELENHLKKYHELFYCRLCVDHIKVFPVERKYYNKRDLLRHKKTGDPDNKSYKGHSSCHLCNTMFFDEDDLLSHLKKDHYNCHFCDPARIKMFFDNYSSLKQHFLDKHFICQEGLCKDEEITSAFANKFDLQAHKAQVHGTGRINRHMVVDLEYDFGNQTNDQHTQVHYQHRNFHEDESALEEEQAAAAQALPTQEDFPQLATSNNLTSSSSNYASMTKNIVSSNKGKTNFSSKFQGPASNQEEFPALAISSNTVPSFAQKKLPVKQAQTKKPLKLAAKANNPSTSAQNNSNNQPSNLKYADIACSFPPLANKPVNENWSKPLPTFCQEDFPDMPIKVKKTNKKTQYVNVRKEAEEKKKKEEEEAKKLQKDNESNDNLTDQKSNNAPLNPFTNDGKILSLKVPPGLHNLSNNNKIPPGFSARPSNPSNSENNAFDMNQLENMANELIKSENGSHDNSNQKSKNQNKNKNPLPSSSHTGYIYPSNFNARNECLLKQVKKELKTDHKFDQFRALTDKFIRSHVNGEIYFKNCLELFDKSFLTSIFSELLVLMPHIKKQTEILTAYEKYFNYNKGAMQKKNPDGSKGVWILTNEKIEFLVCPRCQQVLGLNDGSEHMANHNNELSDKK